MPADTHAHLRSIASPRATEHRPQEPGQCRACRHYVPLSGAAGDDWGVCTSAASSLSACLVAEHTGCGAFEAETLETEMARRMADVARDALGAASYAFLLDAPPDAQVRLQEAAHAFDAAVRGALSTSDSEDDAR